MKINKYILITSALLIGAAAYAEDFDSFGDFGDFGGESSSSSAAALEVNGSVDTEIRSYVDVSDVDDASAKDVEVDAAPSATLDLSYSGNKSDLSLSLKIDEDTIKNHPEDVIDEAILRAYFGNLTLEAGKMKLVWGKGDKLHVLDNFNADDYSDFIIPDYLDRRISTPMIRGVYSLPFANMNIEGVYTPFLPVDRFATDGRWTPAQVSSLTGNLKSGATDNVASAFERYTTATATVGGAGAAYEISKESAAKAKTALETANAAFDKANSIYTDLSSKYSTLQNGYTAYKTVMADATQSATLSYLGVDTNLSFEDFCAQCASFQGYTSYLTAAKAGKLPAGVPATLTYAQFQASSMNPKDKNVSSDTLESLRKGYSEASAAYYATTVAKETAQTTYDSYAEAEKTAGEKYEAAKTEVQDAGKAYLLALTYANGLSEDAIYPDLYNLKYGQYGARVTATLGQVDLGLSYYNGWFKQPSYNADKLTSFIEAYLAKGEVADEDKFLAYDKKQTFGLEASTIIWHFNVRGEFAYNLTDDMDGSDPWVHNNSIAWLGGFDIDLPFWNANLNVQETGSFVLNGDECDNNVFDVDYSAKGYTNNKLVANITTSFLNDKIAPEVTVMYGFERKDLVIMPKLAFKPDQNLTLTASGMYIWCGDDESEFKAWENNSFVSLAANYSF